MYDDWHDLFNIFVGFAGSNKPPGFPGAFQFHCVGILPSSLGEIMHHSGSVHAARSVKTSNEYKPLSWHKLGAYNFRYMLIVCGGRDAYLYFMIRI